MSFWEILATWLSIIPPELKTTVAMLFGMGGFFWMVWDKLAETKRAKLDASISLRQLAQDERRTGVDITSQQTETQLRITEAQQQAANYLAEKIDAYTEKLIKVGELFDDIETAMSGSDCNVDQIMRMIRKSRRELGI